MKNNKKLRMIKCEKSRTKTSDVASRTNIDIKNRQRNKLSLRDELFCKKYMKPWSSNPLKQLQFLISQFANLNAKHRAIKTYYKIRGLYKIKKGS